MCANEPAFIAFIHGGGSIYAQAKQREAEAAAAEEARERRMDQLGVDPAIALRHRLEATQKELTRAAQRTKAADAAQAQGRNELKAERARSHEFRGEAERLGLEAAR